MKYKIEPYKNTQRYNEQYGEIYNFLLSAADNGYNEHFHWGRFEWMMCHTFLDIEELEKVALFKDENESLVGLVTYDTCFDNSVYLIHSLTDSELLNIMIDFAVQNYKIDGKVVIKANDKDIALKEALLEKSFLRTQKDDTILAITLDQEHNYCIPEGIHISPQDFVMDIRKYQNVIHKGFDNEGTPEPWDEELLKPIPHENAALKVFSFNEAEYCSHCGVWYTQGETVYIEPVATIPEFRKKGLAKAAVYEAINRAGKLGAKRAIVISEQEFYFKIGFTVSSEIYCWEKEV